LLCLFEYDLNWDKYVSDLVTRDAFMIKYGDCNIFMNYVQRKLKNERAFEKWVDVGNFTELH
jgi:hypothetical protein